MSRAPYVLQAGPTLPAAGKYFRCRQMFELHSTWHAEPAKASHFATKLDAERLRKTLFPNLITQISIVPLAEAKPCAPVAQDLFGGVAA